MGNKYKEHIDGLTEWFAVVAPGSSGTFREIRRQVEEEMGGKVIVSDEKSMDGASYHFLFSEGTHSSVIERIRTQLDTAGLYITEPPI